MCLYQVWSLLQLRNFFSDSYQWWSNTEMFAKKCNKTLFFQLLSGKYVFSFCIALKWIVVSFFFMWHRLSDCFITKKMVTILDWDSKENLFVQTPGNVCMFAANTVCLQINAKYYYSYNSTCVWVLQESIQLASESTKV